MANETTASVVASFGHGTKTASVFHSTGAPRSAMPQFCLVYDVEKGYAAYGLTKLGARISASSYSEAGSANANTALPALSQLTLTPASYVVTMSPTSEAFNRADPNLVDIGDLLADEMAYPLETLLAYDSSIGVVKYWPTQASNLSGTSGASLTPTTVWRAYQQLCTQLDQEGVDAFLWLNLKGKSDLVVHGFTNSASIYGLQVGANQMLLDLMQAQGLDTSGYVTSWGPIHIFCDPKPAGLGAIAADTIAPMFIPWVQGLNGVPAPRGVAERFAALQRSLPGGIALAPAYAIGYRSVPAAALEMIGGQSQFDREIVTPCGAKIQMFPRGRNGQNLAIIDAFISIVSIEFSDSSVVGVRYATS